MLSSIRKFSKTLFAKLLLVIMIIPFVLWGMGGAFNSGNTNSIAKINNENISTQDFTDFLNNSNIDQNKLKENLDNNAIEELLSRLISNKLLELEINDLNLFVSEESLVRLIKKNKNFLDEKNIFSRTKYEKFLLSQNLTAIDFERRLKENELKKKLFSYISGGIDSPTFKVNNIYKNQTKKLYINFFDLSDKYLPISSFTDLDKSKFIQENSELLKTDYIDLMYLKITPQNLIGSEDYNELFFKKIDEIESKIADGKSFTKLSNEIKIKPVIVKNYIYDTSKNDEDIKNKIYEKRNENQVQLIDENEFYLLYEINKIEKKLPSLKDEIFNNKISNILYQESKNKYNQALIKKIDNKDFTFLDFKKLSNDNFEKIKINSIKDDKKFSTESIKYIYSLPLNSIVLIADKMNNIYLAQINKFEETEINKSFKDFDKFKNQTNIKIRDNIYYSYDTFLNNKYEISINKKTLERVKNYFR